MKRISRKNRIIIGSALALVIIAVVGILEKDKLTGEKFYTVLKGNLETVISVKGEIQGKNAVLITMPDELKRRELQIYELQIKDLIEEGKNVKKGDWIATLDVANITQQIQTNFDQLEKMRAEFNDAQIDSAISLTQLRQELKEFKYDLEYKKLELEQAQFESPAYQRKVGVAYNKTVRQMDKKTRDYELRKLDLKNRTRRIEDRLNYYQRRDSLLKEAMAAAGSIKAPGDGMVMYAKLWGGRKLRVGDYVSVYSSTIATLPDLSVLVSETYVEEIKITKILPGDSVKVTVDAIPNKVFNGFVSKIANIGQELSGFDSKVFKVIVEISDFNPELKPGMTSINDIVINSFSNVLAVPRECLFTENDKTFVFLKKSGKIWKKEVKTGSENDEKIIIESGLEESDKILLTPPTDFEAIKYYEAAL